VDVARPYGAVSPGITGDVLVTLAGTTRALTGREVARLSRRGSPRGVLSVLDRLVEQGLVDRAEAGRALLYTLNRDHVAAPIVVELAQLRSAVFDRITAASGGWRIPPYHLSVFGSFARGDGDTASDVDLFVVRPAQVEEDDRRWRAQLQGLAESVLRWTGNRASIVELGEDDLVRLRSERPAVVGELAADAIVLAGPPVATLLPESGE
jgi:hypothetical protein